MDALHFDNVSLQYGAFPVLQDFTYTFTAGQRYYLMGPSGCGKTTLLRLASGLAVPDTGTIRRCFDTVSYVFQEDRLLPWYSARENVSLVCRRNTPEFWLEAVGLRDATHKLPAELSGGMRRRVVIARALAADGDIYLLDEAFTGLDAAARKTLYPLILQHTQGKLCLFAGHDEAEAAALNGQILSLPNLSR